MKKGIIILLGILASWHCNAQLDAYLDTKYFDSPEGSILESYVEVYASTITYLKDDDEVGRCNVQITQILKKGDSIVDFNKTVLENTETSKDAVYENLMEVNRYVIENRTSYSLEVSIIDLYAPNAKEQLVTRQVNSNWSDLHCEISDIQLVASFKETEEQNVLSKSGYDLLPLLTDFFAPEFLKIAYYFEVYNTKEQFGDDKFIVSHYIENAQSNSVVSAYAKTKRESPQVVIPVLNVFNIENLGSGDYNIVVEVRDKENEIVEQKKIPFKRLSIAADLSKENLKAVDYKGTFVEEMDADSLDEYAFCLYPIVSDRENRTIDYQFKKFDDTLKRQFIYTYWYNVDQQTPQKAWQDYKEQVDLVDQMFGTTVKEGYETDRGRIYLKYGPPYNVDDRPNEPSAYPYQIWHYYKISKFNNKTFVFYLPDLITNDYELLHTDLQGEIQNFKWQQVLNSRNSTKGNIDDANEGNYYHYGTNSGTLFEQP